MVTIREDGRIQRSKQSEQEPENICLLLPGDLVRVYR